MHTQSNDFVPLANIAIQNPQTQAALRKGTGTAYNNRQRAMFSSGDAHGQAMRMQAAAAKRRALDNLPELLEQAEANLIANGYQVLWAKDAAEARELTLQIARKHNVKRVAKSKSMLSEEIGINLAMIDAGLDVIETDLGEWILQLNDEAPSHLVAPVIHKTKDSIRDLFVEKVGMQPTDDAETMVRFAREKLRQAFLDADLGITGGNFVIAETGSVALVMNEGNGRMVTSLPKVHVALVGIEKIAATVADYTTLTQVLPRSGTGQNLTVYTNILNGPRRGDELEGPDAAYVIFVDNGRSDVYATDYAEALACIRCAACLNACPVYRSAGGHAYGWVYGGPIGAVLTPLYTGLENASPLPNASSLCGSCKQVCPVDIDLPRMLLDLRRDLVDANETELKWNIGIKAWAMAHQSAWRFRWSGRMARLGLRIGVDHLVPNPLGEWRKHREFPEFAPKSFHQLWEEGLGEDT